MLDIKVIRENPEKVKQAVKSRNMDMDEKIDEILTIDEKRRAVLVEVESKKANQNAVSKEIPQIKKQGGDTSEIMGKMKKLSDEIAGLNLKLREYENIQKIFYYRYQIFHMKAYHWGKMTLIMLK